MEALFVNHDHMLSTEVDRMTTGKFVGKFRVIFRDLDADAVIDVRFYPTREAAVQFAERLAQQGKVAA